MTKLQKAIINQYWIRTWDIFTAKLRELRDTATTDTVRQNCAEALESLENSPDNPHKSVKTKNKSVKTKNKSVKTKNKSVKAETPCCGAWGQVIGEDERGTEYATPCDDCPHAKPAKWKEE